MMIIVCKSSPTYGIAARYSAQVLRQQYIEKKTVINEKQQ
jgi:hypothetical protein